MGRISSIKNITFQNSERLSCYSSRSMDNKGRKPILCEHARSARIVGRLDKGQHGRSRWLVDEYAGVAESLKVFGHAGIFLMASEAVGGTRQEFTSS